MALQTYAELSTALQNFTARTDTAFTNNIETFVSLGEKEIIAELRVRELQQIDQQVVANGEIILGEDQREFSDMELDADKRVTVDFSSTNIVNRFAQETFRVGGKVYGKIKGDTVKLFPVPPDGTAFNILTRIDPQFLTPTQSTNEIFPKYNHIYWSATLSQAFLWMRENEQAALWEAKSKSQIAVENDRDRKQRQTTNLMAVATRVV